MFDRTTWWLRILSRERGAVLWLPGLAAATWLLLFAIHLAPGGTSLFTHTTSLRVVLGPWTAGSGCEDAAQRTSLAMRRALEVRGAISVIDPARVAQRLSAAGIGIAADPEKFMHAVRPLNAHLSLAGAVTRSDTVVEACVTAYDAHTQQILRRITAAAATPEALGLALADSLRDAAQTPGALVPTQ